MNILLPDSKGQVDLFSEMHVSISLPLNIPGLQIPSIIHPELVSHKLFKHHVWKLPKFNIMTFLESGVLQESNDKTRLKFWDWMRNNKLNINLRERSKLAEIEVWPDANKHLWLLSDLCEPKLHTCAKVLSTVLHRPHKQIIQSGLTTFKKGRQTSLRTIPTTEELRIWFEREITKYTYDVIASKNTKEALDGFESDIVTLMKNNTIARIIKSIINDLASLAQDGSIRKRSNLLSPIKYINMLALPKRFIIVNNKKNNVLNKLSAPLKRPTAKMLLDALLEDPENYKALHLRLKEFLLLTNISSDEWHQISEMSIIHSHGKRFTPNELAFHGKRGNYWGEWKHRLDTKGLSQDDQIRFKAVGVIASTPSEVTLTSKDFFKWLSKQNTSTLHNHIPCVIRHFLHHSGPSSWATVFTDVPCIPIKNKKGIRLISLKAALTGSVYLPDLPILASEAINTDPYISFIIDHVKEVREPASKVFQKLRLKSLRQIVGDPKIVTGFGNVQEGGSELSEQLKVLQSSSFRKMFLKRLNILGIDKEIIRSDWHSRILMVKRILFADKVIGSYRLRQKMYKLNIEAGFNQSNSTFWIMDKNQITKHSFYEGIAAQLIFKSTAKPIDLLALERTLEIEVKESSFRHYPVTDVQKDEFDNGVDEYPEDTWDDDEIGEAPYGHNPFKPDPKKNIPKSGQPLPTVATGPTSTRKRKPYTGQGYVTSTDSEQPELEKEHIDNLKNNQYASHCQICLCHRKPNELAPIGSYVEWQEVRRSIVHAHHVDPKSGSGARHAGNLILLCKYHHDNFGRRLNREMVTQSLRTKLKDMKIPFSEYGKDPVYIDGHIIEVVITDTGEPIQIFFTKEHAKYWLSLTN